MYLLSKARLTCPGFSCVDLFVLFGMGDTSSRPTFSTTFHSATQLWEGPVHGFTLYREYQVLWPLLQILAGKCTLGTARVAGSNQARGCSRKH